MVRLLLGAIVTLLLLAPPAAAVTTTFTGSLDSDWNKAGNWDNGVPTAALDVVIPGLPAPKTVTLATGAAGEANSVTLQSGATLDVQLDLAIDGGAASSFAGTLTATAGGDLSLGGSTTWSAGEWTINAASITNTGTLAVTGTDLTLAHTGGAAPFVNQSGATITKSGAGLWAINVDLQNAGTIAVTAGSMRSRCFCGVPSSGAFNLAPDTTWLIWDAASSSMTLAPGASVTGGTLQLDGDLHLPDAIGATAVDPDVLLLSGGDLVTAEDITLDRLTTDGTSGSVKRGAGTVGAGGPTVLNSVSFQGGATTLTDANLSATGAITVEDSTLNLNGADKTWSAGGWHITGANSTIRNTGKLTVTAPDAAVTHGPGQGQLVNPDGAVIDKTGTGAMTVDPALDNDGTVNVTQGSFRSRTFGPVISDGAFNFAAGTTWFIWDAASSGMDLAPGATVSGGTLQLDGDLNLPDGIGATAVDPATMILSGGDLNTAEDITLDRLTSDGTAGSRKQGAGTVTAGGPTVLNNVDFFGGATTLTDATLSVTGPISTTDTTLNLTGADKTWSAGAWHITGASSSIVNTGKLTVSAPSAAITHGPGQGQLVNPPGAVIDKTGTGEWTVDPALDNDGTLNVAQGSLRSRTFGLTAAGAFNFSPGTAWVIWDAAGSEMVLDAGASVSGGDVTLDGDLRVLAGAGSIDPAAVTLSGGDLVTSKNLTLARLTTDGTVGSGKRGAGTVAAGGPTDLDNVEFQGGATTLTDPSLTITGPLQVSGGTLVLSGAAATWTAGVMTLLNDGFLVNAGGLTVSGAAPQLAHGGGTAELHNQGTLVRSDAGTWTVGPPVRTSGTFTLTGGTVALDNGLTVDGGTLRGTGTLSGTVTQSGGTVAPGTSTGVLTVTGDFTQTAGALQTEIDGPFPDHDRLVVSGTATLGGTVAVVNGHDPAIGAAFDVVTAATVTGAFASLTGGQLAGKHYEATYPAGVVRLVVVKDAAVAPVNTNPPSLPATGTTGETLTCDPGTWSPQPDGFSFTWTRDGAVIPGQTAATYTLTAEDAGHVIACVVVASSGGAQSAPATSNGSAVSAPPVAPTPTPTPSPSPAPTATPTPTPTATPAPATVPIQQIATLPSTRRCVSRRVFRIRLRAPKGQAIASANVFVNGRRVKAVRGRRVTAPVDLRGLPKGRWTVKIVITLKSGKRLQASRRYRTCVPKTRG